MGESVRFIDSSMMAVPKMAIMLKRIGTSILLLVTLAAGGFGCSSSHVNPNDPESLYRDAEDDIKTEHYQIALEKLRSIRNKFPYSKFATESQLRIADVYFLQEEFLEAAASYESFRDLHPTHEKAAYAMFRIAKSYQNDTPTNIARDLTSAQKALDAYRSFIKRYPQATETPDATKDIEKLRGLLASKELYIGDFYYKRDFYDSAKIRYKKVIELYPETPAAAEAHEKLARIDTRAEAESDHGKSNSQHP